jgi:hypothetical protein
MIRLIHEEYLDEMTTIYKDRQYGIMVAVNPDSNRNGLSYFKFYNNCSYEKATHVIRITFKEVNYIIHKDGKKLWKLNSSEKKLLAKVLKQESGKFNGYTNWDIAKYEWNVEYFEEIMNIEKYFNGEYDDIYKNNPGYVSHDLKMPDYTKLNIL